MQLLTDVLFANQARRIGSAIGTAVSSYFQDSKETSTKETRISELFGQIIGVGSTALALYYNYIPLTASWKLGITVAARIAQMVLLPKQAMTIDAHLANGDYMPVFKALRREKNIQEQLQFLRSKQPEFHAPLLFQQALLEFIVAPTKTTFSTISLPLLRIARLRTALDQKCSLDPFISQNLLLAHWLEMDYTNRLEQIAEQKIPNFKTGNMSQPAFYQLLQEVVRRNNSVGLPKPDWVNVHGGSVLPREMHQEIRGAYAQTVLNNWTRQGNYVPHSMATRTRRNSPKTL